MIFKRLQYLLILAGFIVLSGCASVISDPVIQQVNQQASVEAVKERPDTFTGNMVLWSGQIIRTENLKEGTRIEVVHKPADSNSRPKKSDETEGRFLALTDQYLDPAIYERGREVTIAGKLDGMRSLPLGEIEYNYPLVMLEEIHLWPHRQQEIYIRDDFWRYSHRYYYHRGFCCW